jgi:hypothetical protein
MKQSKKKSGKEGKAKKPKYELTYFLDHPQIQRHECVGNQEPKPSLGAQIGFPGMAGSTVKDTSPKPTSQPAQPKAASSKPSLMEQINWGGKFKK